MSNPAAADVEPTLTLAFHDRHTSHMLPESHAHGHPNHGGVFDKSGTLKPTMTTGLKMTGIMYMASTMKELQTQEASTPPAKEPVVAKKAPVDVPAPPMRTQIQNMTRSSWTW